MATIKNTMVTFQTNFHTFQAATENETIETQNQLAIILAAIQSNNQTLAQKAQQRKLSIPNTINLSNNAQHSDLSISNSSYTARKENTPFSHIDQVQESAAAVTTPPVVEPEINNILKQLKKLSHKYLRLPGFTGKKARLQEWYQ